jgi:MFS family permease
MATDTSAAAASEVEARNSWVPMIVIAMGQMLMSFNVSAIPVSMGGMVESFRTPPTTVGTAIVLYSLGVSGFIMLGAKLGQRFGSKIFFQAAVALFLVAMVTMVLSPTAEVMLAAQGLAGFAGAALAPTLVVLIANHYRGKQQTEALGRLGSARAIAGVLAFVIVGTVATMLSWRLAFGLLILHAAAILLLSFRLKPSPARPEVQIDVVGAIQSAVAIIFITFGFNNLRNWGVRLARPAAPFDVLGVSPAPVMIVVGVVILTGFFVWTHRHAAAGKTPLLALEVVDSSREWATVAALFIIVGMEGAINFSVPLYIQLPAAVGPGPADHPPMPVVARLPARRTAPGPETAQVVNRPWSPHLDGTRRMKSTSVAPQSILPKLLDQVERLGSNASRARRRW